MDDDAHVVEGLQARIALGEEGCRPRVALVVEDSHCLHALDELDGLGELVEELLELEEEIDGARKLDKSSRGLLREVLRHGHELVGLGRLRLDLNRVELVVPQVLERHGVVVLDVVPRHLEHFGVDALAFPLHVGVDVAVLGLAQRPLEFDVVGALESRCHVAD